MSHHADQEEFDFFNFRNSENHAHRFNLSGCSPFKFRKLL